MPPARVADGRLPNETDMETRDSCTEVSRAFRRVCQEDLLFAGGSILEPSDAYQGCDDADSIPDWFEKYDVTTGTHSQVTWKGGSGFRDNGSESLKVAIGSELSKKSLLEELAFRFAKV